MTPRRSFFGFLTADGRLQNRWAEALRQPDRGQGLRMLREVRQRVTAEPEPFGKYWEPVLDSMFSAEFVGLLSAQDLADVDAMAEQAAILRLAATTPVEIRQRLVKAFDARRDAAGAVATLTKICAARDTAREARLAAARELARRGADGEPQLKIYVQLLKAARGTAPEPDMARVLERVCAVNFQSDENQLRRAYGVAQELIQGRLTVPGSNSACGIFLLKQRHEPKQAAAHFETAFRQNGRDVNALAGWLGARAQYGDYDLPGAAARQAKESCDPVIGGLVRLNAALEWLDIQDMQGNPPVKAAEIEAVDLTPYAGDAVAMACGRLYLFEREAARATPLLARLAGNYPDELRWRCYHEWACALVEMDPARKLERLRKVRSQLESRPSEFAGVWLRFLDLYLEGARLPQLAASDFEAVERMADSLRELKSPPVGPHEIFERLLEARDARGERQAGSELLVKIYRAAGATADLKAVCAGRLAAREARDEGALEVYITHLETVREPAKENAILTLLAGACAADFTTPAEQLKTKANRAARLIGKVKGAERAMALACLRLPPYKPDQAAKMFQAALEADAADEVALAGFLLACAEDARYSAAKGWGERAQGRRVTEEALRLNASLEWLDEMATGAAPMSAAEAEALTIRAWAPDAVAMSAGRLHLIEGNAARAAALLGPLADRRGGRWNYWAAWAALLAGKADEVARRFEAAADWAERWTIGCMLLDLDPQRKPQGVDWSSGPAAARLQLATVGDSGRKGWQQGREAVEREIEILRTALGQAFTTRQAEAFAQMTAAPLFRRLPAADQALWRGLEALVGGDTQRGRSLLEDAERLGHSRAALALAVLHLGNGRPDLAGPLLERGSGGLPQRKARLLGAYLDSLEGRLKQAHDRLAELAKEVQREDKSKRAVRAEEARIRYTQGYLFLRLAEEARRKGNAKSAQSWRDQAARVLEAALSERDTLPADCELAAHCAAMLAAPEKELRACAESMETLDRLPAGRTRAWIVWLAAVAGLWSEDPERPAAAAEKLVEILEGAGELPEPVAAALAQQTARACLRATRPEHRQALVRLFDLLGAGGDTTREYRRVAIAAAARARYEHAAAHERPEAARQALRLLDADPENGSLALVAAQAQIEALEGPAKAGAILTAVRPRGPAEKFCRVLAGLLCGRAEDGAWREPLPSEARPEVTQIWNVLRAAAAFAAGAPEAGYEALLAALGGPGAEVVQLIDVARVLPALCAVSLKKRSTPPALADTLRRLTSAPVASEDRRMLARCAAAIGESETACALWEQSASGEQAGEVREEYARYLGHLAVQGREKGNDEQALRLLKRAAAAK